MQKNVSGKSRNSQQWFVGEDEDSAASPSYFEWREQTVRMPAIPVTNRAVRQGPFIRLLRRITGRD
ncbi:MAG TPA: hypothetical protein VFR96_11230 [Povalibacter sp.]|jgi:hypothetical protein|nr:hypothetical protein [Povalibacter sp.]